MAATVAGCISEGVPPPMKIVDTVRPGTRAAVAAISAVNARTKRASSMLGVAHVTVEVAIGTFRQAERPVNVDAERRLALRRRRRGWRGAHGRPAPGSRRDPASAADGDETKAGLRELPKGAGAVRQSVVLAAAGRASPRSTSRRTCARARRAGTSDRSQSPCRRAAATRSCRRRGPRIPRRGRPARRRTARRRSAPCAAAASSRRARAAFASTISMARRKFRSGPAQRAEWMPGSPPSASTTSPESSAKAGSPEALAAASALIRALARKVMPLSSGSARPISPADVASMPYGARRSRISASLPGLCVAMTRRPASGR